MNRCCVKHKECKYANSFGVCKLSNLYDCKPADQTEYEAWKQAYLNNQEDEENV